MTGGTQTKNSISHNPKLAYLWWTFNKIWFHAYTSFQIGHEEYSTEEANASHNDNEEKITFISV